MNRVHAKNRILYSDFPVQYSCELNNIPFICNRKCKLAQRHIMILFSIDFNFPMIIKFFIIKLQFSLTGVCQKQEYHHRKSQK